MDETNEIIIGVYGSADSRDYERASVALRVGHAIAEHGATVVTGGCSGLPYAAALGAFENDGAVVAYSPVCSLEEQKEFTPHDELAVYSRIVYTPRSFGASLPIAKNYRNVISTAHVHGAVVIGGGWGTLHEVCALAAYGKPVGIVKGTGGVADLLPGIAWAIEKEGMREDVWFVSDDADLVVEWVVQGCGG